MQRATMWCIARNIQVPATYCFDSKTVGYAATGWWKLQKDKADHTLLRALQQVHEAMAQGYTYAQHIKAHAGHPWNELADTLANTAREKNTESKHKMPDLRPYFGERRSCAEWWWMLWQIHQKDAQYPAMTQDALTWQQNTAEPSAIHSWVHPK